MAVGAGPPVLSVDWVILGFLALESAVALGRSADFPEARWILLANTLGVALVGLVRQARREKRSSLLGRALLELYPIIVLTASYAALDVLSGHAGITTYDHVVQRWELGLFGEQVSRTWWQRAPSELWSSVLHAAYFSYYPVVLAGPLWFLARGEWVALRRAVLWLAATFAICYGCFLFFPVAGPNYQFPPPSGSFLDNPPARLVYALLAKGSSYGAAFPSSHVAAALVAAAAAGFGSRALGLALAAPSVLLIVAVVYCQMHYAVDAMAGVAVGLGVVGGMLLLEKRQQPTVNSRRYQPERANRVA